MEAAVCEIARRGRRVCWIFVDDGESAPRGSSRISLGAQPVWQPADWPKIIAGHASLRAQLNRAVRKKIHVRKLPTTGVDARRFNACIKDWLARKNMLPLRLMAEPPKVEQLKPSHLLWEATHQGRLVAFLIASPLAHRSGFLIEHIVRRPSAPNGTSELLVDACMRELAARKCPYVTMGLVALSRAADPEISRNRWWIRVTMYFARAHCSRFYNFRGVEEFRKKMMPHNWEIFYAASDERQFSLATFRTLLTAFFGRAPEIALLIAAGRAVRQELRWAMAKLMRAKARAV